MSLSFIKVPEYDLTLSNNNVVKYRPFLIKEEKVLLMAVESRDEAEMNNALINIVQSCTISKVDVTKLPVYDFEYLWLNIRGKSVGEQIDLKLKCPDDEKQTVDYSLKIEDVKPDLNKKFERKVEFEKDYGVIMKVPTIKHISNKKTLLDLSYGLVRDCIDQIYNGDEVFESADLSAKELDEFVNHLTTRQFNLIRKYFESLPVVSHLIKYKNPKSGKDFTLTLQGASDFFQ
tara:strand:- start:343 stop:1038 length:696 start_codon:yes stop_codon:yes gene_type:complete